MGATGATGGGGTTSDLLERILNVVVIAGAALALARVAWVGRISRRGGTFSRGQRLLLVALLASVGVVNLLILLAQSRVQTELLFLFAVGVAPVGVVLAIAVLIKVYLPRRP